MAYSHVSYLGTGSQTDFAIPFPYLDPSHVEASVNSVPKSITFPNSSTARFSPAPAAGAVVTLRRNTSRAERLIDFATGVSLNEDVLDTDSLQAFYLAQEAIDQSSTQSYFSADAGGSRVTNVADPINDTDGVNKQYLATYVTAAIGGIGGGGLDLRPLNNVWTGTNTFNSTVTVKGATFDGAEVATKEWLKLDKGLFVTNISTNATQPGYGFAASVKRSSGYAQAIGQQIDAYGLSSWSGLVYGASLTAWRGRDSNGTLVGTSSSVVSLNPNDEAEKVGFNVTFYNRESGASQGGNAQNVLGLTGYGTGANKYNTNTRAIQVQAQARSESGATYCGWNRGIVFDNGSLDVAILPAYSGSVAYRVGQQVTSGGVNYQCRVATSPGIAPPNASYWVVLESGSAPRKAIGIDFSGMDDTTAGNIRTAIKIRNQMPITWDTEEFIDTKYDPLTGRWSLYNMGVERNSFDVTTGDVLVNLTRRLQATRSFVSVHRNTVVQSLSTGFNRVNLTTEEADSRSEFNNATYRFTPNTPGVYAITAQVESDTGAPAGERLSCVVYKNGVAYKASSTVTVSGKQVSANVACLVQMNGSTDYIELYAYWGGAGTGYITGEPAGTYLQATKHS